MLRRHGRDLAESCLKRCYETWPELEDRFGARGRQHATRDAYWHLEYLDNAIAAGEPLIFVEYADWLTGLLAVRGIGMEQVAGAFGFLADRLEAVDCAGKLEGHRRALLAMLRDNQARLLHQAD